jgi:hypothetical protein
MLRTRVGNVFLAVCTIVAVVAMTAIDNVGAKPPAPKSKVDASRARLLPRELLTSAPAATYAVPLGVPVGALDRFQFFVIPGLDQQVCLMGVRGKGAAAESFGGCSPIDVLKRGVIWRARQDGRVWDVAGLVADGYTRVTVGRRTVPVTNNVFLLRLTGSHFRVVASGPTVARRAVSIGTGRGVGGRYR